MGGFKFGPASMRGLTQGLQPELQAQLEARRRAAEMEDYRIKQALEVQGQKDLAESKYKFDAQYNPDNKLSAAAQFFKSNPYLAMQYPEQTGKAFGIDLTTPKTQDLGPEWRIDSTGKPIRNLTTPTADILSREKMNQEDNDRAYNLAMLKAASGGGGGGGSAAYANLIYRMQKDAEDRAIKAREKQDEEKRYAKEAWRNKQNDITNRVMRSEAYKKESDPIRAEKMISSALAAEWKKTDTDIKKYYKRNEPDKGGGSTAKIKFDKSGKAGVFSMPPGGVVKAGNYGVTSLGGIPVPDFIHETQRPVFVQAFKMIKKANPGWNNARVMQETINETLVP